MRNRIALLAALALSAGATTSLLDGHPTAAQDASPNVTQLDLISPALGGENFGERVVVLANGNYVVIDQGWDNGIIANVGAVYLYDGATNTVISTLTGSTANDLVGSEGVTALTNGNYVVSSQSWTNGAIAGVGAATWVNGETGINGPVTAANSLHGTTTGDSVGQGGAHALSNGNYVVTSRSWDFGAVAEAGAATWGNGATGITGPVTAANSPHGTQVFDYVGTNEVTVLANGNYVVTSPNWAHAGAPNAGAATWGNGATGIPDPSQRPTASTAHKPATTSATPEPSHSPTATTSSPARTGHMPAPRMPARQPGATVPPASPDPSQRPTASTAHKPATTSALAEPSHSATATTSPRAPAGTTTQPPVSVRQRGPTVPRASPDPSQRPTASTAHEPVTASVRPEPPHSPTATTSSPVLIGVTGQSVAPVRRRGATVPRASPDLSPPPTVSSAPRSARASARSSPRHSPTATTSSPTRAGASAQAPTPVRSPGATGQPESAGLSQRPTASTARKQEIPSGTRGSPHSRAATTSSPAHSGTTAPSPTPVLRRLGTGPPGQPDQSPRPTAFTGHSPVTTSAHLP